MRLSTAKIQNATAQKKTVRLFDGRGLYLEIAPTGSRWWRLKYRFAGKEKRISLGVYPHVGLKKARDRRDEMITTTFSHPANAATAGTAGFRVISLMPDSERGYPSLDAFRATAGV